MTQAQNQNPNEPRFRFEHASVVVVNTTDIFGEDQRLILITPDGVPDVLVAKLLTVPVPLSPSLETHLNIGSMLQDALNLVQSGGLAASVDSNDLERIQKKGRDASDDLSGAIVRFAADLDSDTFESMVNLLPLAKTLSQAQTSAEARLAEVAFDKANEAAKQAFVERMQVKVEREMENFKRSLLEVALEALGPDASEEDKIAVYNELGLTYPGPDPVLAEDNIGVPSDN